MSFTKSVLEGLNWIECKRGIAGKNSPVCYIPKQDPVQDALGKSTGNKLKVAVWASGTLEQFLMHVRSAFHVCKQMGLDTEFAKAEKNIETANLDVDIMKNEFVQARNSQQKGKNKGSKVGESKTTPTALTIAKANHESALKALEAAKLSVTMAGVKAFELYENLLSNEARQPWEKIIKAQVTPAPWEDIYGDTHEKTQTKTWDSFMECVTFHLLQVFCHDVGGTLKYTS